MSKTFNTYIISIDGFKAVKQVGKDQTAKDAETTCFNIETRLKLEDYFVDSYDVGSERDIECGKQAKKSDVEERIIFNK